MVGARGLVIGYGQRGRMPREGLVGASEEVTLFGSIGHDCTHCGGNGSLGGVPSTPGIYGCICSCSQCCDTCLRCICCTSPAMVDVAGGGQCGQVAMGARLWLSYADTLQPCGPPAGSKCSEAVPWHAP